MSGVCLSWVYCYIFKTASILTGTWSNEAQKEDKPQENPGRKTENNYKEDTADEDNSENKNNDEETVYDFTLDVPKN